MYAVNWGILGGVFVCVCVCTWRPKFFYLQKYAKKVIFTESSGKKEAKRFLIILCIFYLNEGDFIFFHLF